MAIGAATRSALRLLTTLLLVASAMSALGCRRPNTCDICAMQIPPDTRAVIDDEGRRRVVCDPRCALTYQQQTGRRVVLSEVRDFTSQARLDPRTAFYVTGSDTSPDAHATALAAWPSEQALLHWHRCLPSVLAFSTRSEADRFQQLHGGRVMTLSELGFRGRN